MMQQVLVAHEVPARIVDLGVMPYMGLASPAALQVRAEDRWTALMLLSPLEEEIKAETDSQD